LGEKEKERRDVKKKKTNRKSSLDRQKETEKGALLQRRVDNRSTTNRAGSHSKRNWGKEKRIVKTLGPHSGHLGGPVESQHWTIRGNGVKKGKGPSSQREGDDLGHVEK